MVGVYIMVEDHIPDSFCMYIKFQGNLVCLKELHA